MTNQEIVLEVLRAMGRADALELREKANELSGTAIIDREQAIPQFDPEKDYSAWPAGSPVQYDGQIYKLITPYDASNWPDQRPSDLPSLWSICHTKDPKKAKPYLPPNGKSGTYSSGECCTEDGHVWRSRVDSNVWYPSGYPDGWEDLGSIEEVMGGE